MTQLDDNPYKNDKEDYKAAQDMDKISKTVFVKVYPLIASQIKSKHSVDKGTCIDLGSGPAALSIALAKETNLQIHAVDMSKYSFEIALKNIAEQGMEKRITPVKADVVKLPFDDNFADLIVSRGSIFFWEDLPSAFNEIYRVLKPGGRTHIGGGFGSAQLKKSIIETMNKKGDDFSGKMKNRQGPENIKRITSALDQSNVISYDFTRSDEAGFWIHMRKEIS